jgi:hypothetical protein
MVENVGFGVVSGGNGVYNWGNCLILWYEWFRFLGVEFYPCINYE